MFFTVSPPLIFNLNLTSGFVFVCVQAYDPQTMYDTPYFRSAVDETAARVQSMQFPQEVALQFAFTNKFYHFICIFPATYVHDKARS